MFDSIAVPDERAARLAAAVRTLDLGYRAARQEVYEEAGIGSAELDALVALADIGPMTAKMLASATDLTTSATTALIDRMERGGLLERRAHPTDRRSVVLVPTDRGRGIISEAWRSFVGRFEILLAERPCAAQVLDELVVRLEHLAEVLPAPRALRSSAA